MMKNTLKKRIAILILGAMFAFCFAMAGVTVFKSQADSKVYPQNKVELYQLAPSENLYEGYIIKTSNDELVVIDGGAATDDNPAYIDAALTAIAGREDYTVKYWFLSHAHDDHIYELAKILNFETIDFTIENIVFDFPKSFPATGAMSDVSKGALNLLKTGLDNYAEKKGLTYVADSYYEELNGKYVNETSILEGQTITVDNIDFEILQTWSIRDTQVNSNSMVIRMWVDGQSVLFLNDATIESGNRLIETYGREYLKSDIVQMAHHGQKGTAKNVYDAVDAKVRLWPCFSTVWVGSDTDTYQTKEVRSWVGLPEEASAFAQSEYDLVAALCESPSDVTSVSAWEQVLDGMKMELPYLPVYEHDFFMNGGASIRTDSDSTGIRFTATLTSYDPDTQYGFVIAPRSWLDALNVSENYAKSLIEEYGTEEDGVILLKSKVHQVYNHFEINGSIAKILDKNIGLDFVGIAYAYKDGVYTDAYMGDLANVTRNVGQVAAAARNDYDKGGYEYDEDELKVIGDFISTAAGSSEITLAFTQEAVEMTVFESKTLSVTSNVSTDNAIWSSSEPEVISVENGVVTAHKVGSAVITVKNAGKTATCTVTSVAEDNAIVSFSNDASEKIVRDVPPEVRTSRRAGGLVEAEWLESYKGAEGVVKVTSRSGVTGTGIADVRIELPVAIAEGATIKFYIEKSDATFFYFYDGTNYNRIKDYYSHASVAIPSNLKDCWAISYIPYAESITDRSAINILIAGGSNNTEHVFYIDVIKQGNVVSEMTVPSKDAEMAALALPLASSLEDPYLADFSSADYEKLVGNQKFTEIGDSNSSSYAASALSAEYLETYKGETSVLKVTATTTNGGFSIRLPKAIGNDGFTIRFMIEEMSDDTLAIFQILNPYTNATSKWEIYDSGETQNIYSNIGVWKTVHVSAYDKVADSYKEYANNYVDFRLYTSASSTKVIYIDYIGTGDCADEIIAEKVSGLPGKLAENYLADFSEAAYTYTAGYSTNSTNKAVSLSAEYLPSYADADGYVDLGVLKVTTVAGTGGGGRGNIVINLPKPTTGKVTIKYMIPECNSSYVYFLEPGEVNAPTYGTSLKTSTTWQYITYTQTATNSIEILFANTKSATNTVYFACIMEGDQVDSLKEQAYSQTITYLADNLEEGCLADFSNRGYQVLLTDDPYGTTSNAKTKMAEYVKDYNNGTEDDTLDDETDLLRVTTTNNTYQYGDFAINLPKEIKNGFTVRFKIESTSSSVFRILYPGEQTEDVYEKAYSSLTSIVGEWITVNVPLDEKYTVKDQIVFQFWGTTTATNVILIDYVNEYTPN